MSTGAVHVGMRVVSWDDAGRMGAALLRDISCWCRTRSLTCTCGFPQPRELVDANWRASERRDIARYLDSGVAIQESTGDATCPIGGCGFSYATTVFSDGAWMWTAAHAHLVREHHVRLPEELVSHMRGRAFAPASWVDATESDGGAFWRMWALRTPGAVLPASRPEPTPPFRVGFWDEPARLHPADPRACVDASWDRGERSMMVSAMRRAPVAMASEVTRACSFCGATSRATEHTHAEWTWPAGYAHEIEAHDIKPPWSFVIALLRG